MSEVEIHVDAICVGNILSVDIDGLCSYRVGVGVGVGRTFKHNLRKQQKGI